MSFIAVRGTHRPQIKDTPKTRKNIKTAEHHCALAVYNVMLLVFISLEMCVHVFVSLYPHKFTSSRVVSGCALKDAAVTTRFTGV